jgi:hypothetical protein
MGGAKSRSGPEGPVRVQFKQKRRSPRKKTVATEKGSSDGLHTFTYDLQTFTYGIHLLHFKKIPDFSNQAQIKRNKTQTHLFLPPDHESKLGFHI